MIAIYLFFSTLSILFYFFAKKFNIRLRNLFSILIFIVPSLFFTIWIMKIGDRVPVDSEEYHQENNGNEMRNKPISYDYS